MPIFYEPLYIVLEEFSGVCVCCLSCWCDYYSNFLEIFSNFLMISNFLVISHHVRGVHFYSKLPKNFLSAALKAKWNWSCAINEFLFRPLNSSNIYKLFFPPLSPTLENWNNLSHLKGYSTMLSLLYIQVPINNCVFSNWLRILV